MFKNNDCTAGFVKLRGMRRLCLGNYGILYILRDVVWIPQMQNQMWDLTLPFKYKKAEFNFDK